MALRYWIWSGLSALLAVVMAVGCLWLGMATGRRVNVPAPQPTIIDPFGLTQKPVAGLQRQDVDAMLVTDFSGSIYGAGDPPSPPTDPNDVRLDAAELAAGSLAADIFPRVTRMGYIAFGTDIKLWQPLTPMTSTEARATLITNLRKPGDMGYTNILDALHCAYVQLVPGIIWPKQDTTQAQNCPVPSGQHASGNKPVIVLLTDGYPQDANNYNTESSIRSEVGNLTSHGVLLVVIILRNPGAGLEDSHLTYWRQVWYRMSLQNPLSVQYYDAQSDRNLPDIYSNIIKYLDPEGTTPGAEVPYDPSAGIVMPRNLLKAVLRVSLPKAGRQVKSPNAHVDLLAPDGTPFALLAKSDPRNDGLTGYVYNRYTLFEPPSGRWTLTSPDGVTLSDTSYILDTESLYSVRLAMSDDRLYVSPDVPTTLDFTVDQIVTSTIGNDASAVQRTITTKPFSLTARATQQIINPDGSIGPQYITLTVSAPVSQSDGTWLYHVIVPPQVLRADQTVDLTVDGQADDGTPLNVYHIVVAAARAPSGARLQVPSRVVCAHERLVPWPPQLLCRNTIPATLTVEDGDLLVTGTLAGQLYPPGSTAVMPMRSLTQNILQRDVSISGIDGQYGVSASAVGQVTSLAPITATSQTTNTLGWNIAEASNIALVWPRWVPDWKARLLHGAILLGLLALWRPLLVPLLLFLFRRLRVAPDGYYTVDDTEDSINRVYQTARRRHKLFTINLGCERPGGTVDTRIWHDDIDAPPPIRRRRRIVPARLADALTRWIESRPKARLVMVPGRGLYGEGGGEWVAAGQVRPTRLTVGHTRIYICQRDWKDEQPSPTAESASATMAP